MRRKYYCGTCCHKEFKYEDLWNDKSIDGFSAVCLITLKDVTRHCECDCRMHSGETKEGYDKRQNYVKPYIINN